MFSIRKIHKNDYGKKYLELLENLTTVNRENINSESFEYFVSILNKNHIINVIEHDNVIISTGTLFIENKIIHGFGKVGHIEDIVVDPTYNGKNLGRTIVNSLINYAKEEKCYKIILDCDDKVSKFYEKCGFIKKGNQMSLYFQ